MEMFGRVENQSNRPLDVCHVLRLINRFNSRIISFLVTDEVRPIYIVQVIEGVDGTLIYSTDSDIGAQFDPRSANVS